MKFAQGLQGALKQGKKVQVLVWFELDSTGVMVRGKISLCEIYTCIFDQDYPDYESQNNLKETFIEIVGKMFV